MLRLRTASQATAKLSPRPQPATRIAEARSIHTCPALHQPSRDGSSSGGGGGSSSSGRSSKPSSSIDASSSSAAAAAAAAADAARAYTRSLYDPRQRSAHWLKAAPPGKSPSSTKAKAKPSVKLSDKRSTSIEQYRVDESTPPGGAQKGEAAAAAAGSGPGAGAGTTTTTTTTTTQAGPSATSTGPSSMTSEDLLKQRLRQEQERFERRTMPVGQNEAVLVSAGYGGPGASSSSSASPAGAATASAGGGVGGAGSGGSSGPPPSSSSSDGIVEGAPDLDDAQSSTAPSTPSGNLESRSVRPPRLENPFDSHRFVQRLLEGGFVPRMQRVMEEAGAREEEAAEMAAAADQESRSGEEQLAEGELLERNNGAQLQAARRHDPAEAIMEAVRHLIVSRHERVIDLHMNKTQVENESYLFSAALSELRTELQVRARNDATALRSITTLLQREVDALDQKMREDINTLKHDIQVDMNNRKGESKEEQNSLEQEIQDLNNRFTISISDLKTEIEQNIKWDATRRALTLVFGIAIIAVATLVLAEYLGRDEDGSAAGIPSSPQGANAKLGLPPAAVVGGRAASAAGASGPAGNRGAARVMSDSTDSTSYDALLDLANVRPKSAEELGLVPKYEDAEAGRYV